MGILKQCQSTWRWTGLFSVPCQEETSEILNTGVDILEVRDLLFLRVLRPPRA